MRDHVHVGHDPFNSLDSPVHFFHCIVQVQVGPFASTRPVGILHMSIDQVLGRGLKQLFLFN